VLLSSWAVAILSLKIANLSSQLQNFCRNICCLHILLEFLQLLLQWIQTNFMFPKSWLDWSHITCFTPLAYCHSLHQSSQSSLFDHTNEIFLGGICSKVCQIFNMM
jgi:phosphate starvation-inducible membrane PsiE